MKRILFLGIAVVMVGAHALEAAAPQAGDLIGAARVGNLEEVRRLIAGGADINAKDELGRTALMLAAKYGHFEVAQALIGVEEIDANAKDQSGNTALMGAALYGKTDILKELLAIGADVNIQESLGLTALMIAAISGNTAGAQALLDAGADPTITNDDGETAADLAVNNQIREMLKQATPTKSAAKR